MTKYSRHCLATLKYFCIKEEFDSITIVQCKCKKCLQFSLRITQGDSSFTAGGKMTLKD
jgi:hypothetical protein